MTGPPSCGSAGTMVADDIGEEQPTDPGLNLSREQPEDVGLYLSRAKVTFKLLGLQVKIGTSGGVQERSWVALTVVVLLSAGIAYLVDRLMVSAGKGQGWAPITITIVAFVVGLIFGTWFLGRFTVRRARRS